MRKCRRTVSTSLDALPTGKQPAQPFFFFFLEQGKGEGMFIRPSHFYNCSQVVTSCGDGEICWVLCVLHTSMQGWSFSVWLAAGSGSVVQAKSSLLKRSNNLLSV